MLNVNYQRKILFNLPPLHEQCKLKLDQYQFHYPEACPPRPCFHSKWCTLVRECWWCHFTKRSIVWYWSLADETNKSQHGFKLEKETNFLRFQTCSWWQIKFWVLNPGNTWQERFPDKHRPFPSSGIIVRTLRCSEEMRIGKKRSLWIPIPFHLLSQSQFPPEFPHAPGTQVNQSFDHIKSLIKKNKGIDKKHVVMTSGSPLDRNTGHDLYCLIRRSWVQY